MVTDIGVAAERPGAVWAILDCSSRPDVDWVASNSRLLGEANIDFQWRFARFAPRRRNLRRHIGPPILCEVAIAVPFISWVVTALADELPCTWWGRPGKDREPAAGWCIPPDPEWFSWLLQEWLASGQPGEAKD